MMAHGPVLLTIAGLAAAIVTGRTRPKAVGFGLATRLLLPPRKLTTRLITLVTRLLPATTLGLVPIWFRIGRYPASPYFI